MSKVSKVIFDSEYSGESIIDLEQDLSYMIESVDIEKDAGTHIHTGTFRVTVTWTPDE